MARRVNATEPIGLQKLFREMRKQGIPISRETRSGRCRLGRL